MAEEWASTPTRWAITLRVGLVSEADRRRVPDRVITQITGHRSTTMLTTYSRPRSLFADGPARYFNVGESVLSEAGD